MMQDSTERAELLDAYKNLRVADVRDGMDVLGMHRVGSLPQTIRPLWRTRVCGIALTARYGAYDGMVPRMTPEQYARWTAWYYQEVCPYPWMDDLQDGDFVVISADNVDAGLMGSENTLSGLRKGAVGYLTTGGVRDTDEIINQAVPFWAQRISQSMVQGRLQYRDHNKPLQIGPTTVHPGDIIVADGDGVICVPRAVAMQVANHAAAEHKRDMAVRREHYQALGMEPDESV
ncbi:MAG: RraA family protein [Phycisphaerae bacterium]